MKDNRYKAIKSLIETKSFKSLGDIFDILPLTVVREDMGMNYNTLRRRIQSPGLLTVDDINKLSSLIDVNPGLIMELALIDVKNSTRIRKRK